MTGFGAAEAQSKRAQYELTVRAVNGRFLEIRFHLPREMQSLEADMRKMIEKLIGRGTVDVYLGRKLRWESLQPQVVLNQNLAKQLVLQSRKLAKAHKISSELSLESLLRFPDVLKVESTNESATGDKKMILALLEKALLACDLEKKREGKSLQLVLLEQLSKLDEHVTAIEKFAEK